MINLHQRETEYVLQIQNNRMTQILNVLFLTGVFLMITLTYLHYKKTDMFGCSIIMKKSLKIMRNQIYLLFTKSMHRDTLCPLIQSFCFVHISKKIRITFNS